MPRVSHHFVADRPINAVFDVVTTARFWPEWHPVGARSLRACELQR